MKIAFTLFISLFTFNGFSQKTETSLESDRMIALINKLEGTYQYQIIDSRELPEISLSLLDKIEEKRHETDTVYFFHKPSVKILVLPASVINKKGYIQLKRVVHKSN